MNKHFLHSIFKRQYDPFRASKIYVQLSMIYKFKTLQKPGEFTNSEIHVLVHSKLYFQRLLFISLSMKVKA